MTNERQIAVLCAGSPSAYDNMPAVDVYNKRRDARTFPGGSPIVAHPPCRSWSAFCGHQAKPEADERYLGIWCVEQVRKWGGILEQPAHSRLWEAAGIPPPGGHESRDSWSASVWQSWWGYPMRKATWLYFCGVNPQYVQPPLILHPGNGDRRAEQVMSHRQRSETIRPFAEWLVAIARHAKTPQEVRAA